MSGAPAAIRARLLSRSAVLVAGRVLGAGLALAAQAAIARTWGADALGDYMLAMAAATLAGLLLPLGFSIIAGFLAAQYAATGRAAAIRAFVLQGSGHVAALSLLAGAAGLAFGSALPTPFDRVWAPCLAVAVGTAASYLAGGVLVGLRRPLVGIAGDVLGRPLVLAGSTAALLAASADLTALPLLLWSIAAGIAAVATLQVAVLVRAVSALATTADPPAGMRRDWLRYALAWAAVTLATDFVFELDLLLLAPLLDAADIAVFGLCVRLFSLAAFAAATLGALALPDIAAASGEAATGAVAERSRDATLLATGLALAAALAAFALGGPVVGAVFGPEFGGVGAPLAILCLGLAARCAAGPTALLLSLHDAPFAPLPPLAAGLAVMVVGNLLLVPSFGIDGAAVAAALALAVGSVGLRAVALGRTGIDVSLVGILRRRAPGAINPAGRAARPPVASGGPG